MMKVKDRRLEEILPLRPLENLVFIDPCEIKDEIKTVTRADGSKVGIFMPDRLKDEIPLQGRVWAVGSGATVLRCQDCGGNFRVPCQLKVGDIVLYGRNVGTAFQYELSGETYEFVIARDDLIYATLEE
jgi:co-chaperonin GroES (HSP10)